MRCLAGLVLGFGVVTGVFAQVSLQISPDEVVLGQFDARNPVQNLTNPGETVVHINSPVDWRLFGMLMEPLRRTTDGQELPLERIRQFFPQVADEFAGYQPFEVDHGGGRGWDQVFNLDWQVLEMRSENYFDPGDPPGIYRTSMQFTLRDNDGAVMAPPVTVHFEFEILPWVEIELPTSVFDFFLDGQQGMDSQPYSILIRSNGPWALTASCSGDLIQQDGEQVVEMERLSWSVPPGAGWQSDVPDFLAVTREPTLLAHAEAPAPFDIVEFNVELVLRAEGGGVFTHGLFLNDLFFDVVSGSVTR